MSRRRRVHKKEEKLDAQYASPLVAQLISTIMKSGKKSLAERIVYQAIEKSREGTESVDPLDVLNRAIDNIKPRLEVKSRSKSRPSVWWRWRCAGSSVMPAAVVVSA